MPTQYILLDDGTTAQDSAINRAMLDVENVNYTIIDNDSNEVLLSDFIEPALGCTGWLIPDLTNNNTLVTTFPTDELQAFYLQVAPMAQVPALDPDVTSYVVNGASSVFNTTNPT